MQEYPWIVAFWMPALGIYWITTKIVKHLFRGPVEVPVKRDASGFRTHEEYLEARRSMNLGDFLDLAYATREDIKRGARNEFHLQAGMAGSDGANGVGFMASGASAKLWPDDGPLSDAVTVTDLQRAVYLDMTTSYGTCVHEHGCAPLRTHDIKCGTWLRNKSTKELFVVIRKQYPDGWYLLENRVGQISQYAGCYAMAVPMPDEHWYQYSCQNHARICEGPIHIQQECDRNIEYAQCGCLWPLNYGKGY